MAKEGNLEESVKGTIWMSLGSLANYAINLLATYVLARLLSAADYGEVSAVTVLTGFADIFWQIGVGQALIQKKDLSKNDITTGFYINSGLCLLIFTILEVFAPFWSKVFSISSVKMLRVYTLIYIINGALAIPLALAQRNMRFKFVAIVEVVANIFWGITVVMLAFLNWGPWALVAGSLVRYTVKAIVINSKERISYDPRLCRKDSLVQLLNFGGGFTIAKAFNYIANNGDYFVINKTLGKVDLGNYQKSYNLMMYPANLVGSNLESVFFPVFSRNQSDRERLGRAFSACNVLIELVTIPISLVAFYVAKPLILFFLGSKWENVIPAFRIMIVGLFFRTAYKLSIALLKAQGKVYQNAVIQGIYAALVVGGAYIGHFWGLPGVAYGITLAFTANYFMLLLTNNHFIGFGIVHFVRDAMIPLIYAGVIIIFAPLLSDIWMLPQSDFLKCVVCTLIVFSIYFLEYLITHKIVFSKEVDETIVRTGKSIGAKLLRKK